MRTNVLTLSSPLLLQMVPVVNMTANQFYEFCQINKELRIERTTEGNLIIMAPAGAGTGRKNADIITDLNIWARRDKSGVVFDSSAGFTFPNGAVRSPDASWVKRSKLAALTDEKKKGFISLSPDFVIELRSPTDSLTDLKEKMQEYMDNGVELGWLIDPRNKQVHIYRVHHEVECLNSPAEVSGDSVLPGFVLDLEEIWQPAF